MRTNHHGAARVAWQAAPDLGKHDAPVKRGVTEASRQERAPQCSHWRRLREAATAKARAALAGYALTELPDGAFVVARWGACRELAHLAAVANFLRRVAP